MDDTNPTRASLLEAMKFEETREAAWEEWYRIYYPRLVRMALRRGAQLADAEIGAADTVYEMVNRLPKYNHDPSIKGGFRARLNKILRQRMDRLYGDHPQEQNNKDFEMQNVENQHPKTEDFVDELVRGETNVEMRAAIMKTSAEVPEKIWLSWHLTEDKDMSPKAAAELVGISIAYLYVCKSRFVKQVLKNFERNLA